MLLKPSRLSSGVPPVSQELLAARRKVAQDTAARLRTVHQKSARAEARRAKHLEQLGEAQRAAAVAKRTSEVNLLYIRGELEPASTYGNFVYFRK